MKFFSLSKNIALVTLTVFIVFSVIFTTRVKSENIPKAQAFGSFGPTSSQLVLGTALPFTTAASGTGSNAGSWRATLAQDNIYWNVSNTGTGFNQHVRLDGSQLNNANKFDIKIRASSTVTTLQRAYQICDWVTTTGVDNAADAQCTGGGWRTLNLRRVNITTTTNTLYRWNIYDGYFTTGMSSNTPVSTPLSNFIKADATKRILIRAYSSSTVAAVHALDYVNVEAVVDPIYTPASHTIISGGVVAGVYTNTVNGTLSGQSASDNIRLGVPGTALVRPDFYLSYKNVRTFPSANTIVVRSEGGCSANGGGNNYTVKIFNFTTASWENISPAITCNTADSTGSYAKNNINVNDYISGGEIRVGYVMNNVTTVAIQVDMAYVIIGSTNTDTAECQVSFGTGTLSACTNTRTLDTRTPAGWAITSAVESLAMGASYYPFDNDTDAVSAEHAWSVNVGIPMQLPANVSVVGFGITANWVSQSVGATLTTQAGARDYSGETTSAMGGWAPVTTTSAGTTYTYVDPMSVGFITTDPAELIDFDNNKSNIRIRTAVSTETTTTRTGTVDFVMATARWVESSPSYPSQRYQYTPTGNALLIGTNAAISSGVTNPNVGDWKGLLRSDSATWTVNTNPATGLDQQVHVDGVELKGANKIQINLVSTGTITNRFYEICDWVSSSGVDAVADAQCTGGGWRRLSPRKQALTSVGTYRFQIYDGFFSPSVSSPTSVPTQLSNFIKADATKRVLIRAYTPTGVTATHGFDYVEVIPFTDSLYMPAGQEISAGTPTNNYLATIGATLPFISAVDSNRFSVAGTLADAPDAILVFRNIKTYTGSNSFMVRTNTSCSAAGTSYLVQVYNFTTASWEALSSVAIPCSTTASNHTFSKNPTSISDYISNTEAKVRFVMQSPTTNSLQIDSAYMVLGTVNTDSAVCEISFGTGTATNCTNTRTIDTSTASSSWSITSELESGTAFGHDYYGYDNDTDVTNGESAWSVAVPFTFTLPTSSFPIALGAIGEWQGTVTAGNPLTTIAGFRDYSQRTSITGGFTFVTGSVSTNLTHEDGSNGTSLLLNNTKDYFDAINNSVVLKIRTSASTGATSQNGLIDYLAVYPQWVDNRPPQYQFISLSISDNTVGFGTLSSASTRYATGDTLGSGSEVNAHIITASTNASNGYVVQIYGDTLTSAGGDKISGTSSVATAPAIGTEQFGLRGVVTGGTGGGVVSTPYDSSNYAFDIYPGHPSIFASGTGNAMDTSYATIYMANINPQTKSGTYTTSLNYVITSTY
jgi:hypothetical protein